MVFTQIIVFFRVVQESVTGESGEHSGLWKKRGSTIKMGEKQKDTTHKQDYLWGREYYLVRVWPQSRPTLCDSMNCSPPGSSVHGIFQARILKWTAIPFFRVSSQPRYQIQVSYTAGRFFTTWAIQEAGSLLERRHQEPPCTTKALMTEARALGNSPKNLMNVV